MRQRSDLFVDCREKHNWTKLGKNHDSVLSVALTKMNFPFAFTPFGPVSAPSVERLFPVLLSEIKS